MAAATSGSASASGRLEEWSGRGVAHGVAELPAGDGAHRRRRTGGWIRARGSSARALRGGPRRTACRGTRATMRVGVGPRTRRPASDRTLRSLCSRASAAPSTSPITAARMPGTLLAAIAMPTPLPQTRMPRSAWPAATASATGRGVVGIVDRRGRRGAEVAPADAARVERTLQRFFQLEARVVGAERDEHARDCTLRTRNARRFHLSARRSPPAPRTSLDLPVGCGGQRRRRRRRRGRARRAASACWATRSSAINRRSRCGC